MIRYRGILYKNINAYQYIDKYGLENCEAKLESCIEYSEKCQRDILPDGMGGTLAEFKQAIADFKLVNRTLTVEEMQARNRLRSGLEVAL